MNTVSATDAFEKSTAGTSSDGSLTPARTYHALGDARDPGGNAFRRTPRRALEGQNLIGKSK